MRPTPTIDEVRQFWTDNPLFAGEGTHQVGSREWFTEHETAYMWDVFAGSVPDIYVADVTAETRLLDAGCGPGIWVRYFLRRGVRDVSACDLTGTAVELTKHSLELFGLTARVEVGDIERLPFSDGAFDHINCNGVIHHTPNPDHAVNEFRRVLRRGGTLCVSVYHRGWLLRHPSMLRALRPLLAAVVTLKGRGREALLGAADPDEIVRLYDGARNPLGRSYTVAELRALLRGKFDIAEVGFVYFPSRVLPLRIPRRVHAWLSRHFGMMVVLRCRACA